MRRRIANACWALAVCVVTLAAEGTAAHLTAEHTVPPMKVTQRVYTLDNFVNDMLATGSALDETCELPQDWPTAYPGINPDWEVLRSTTDFNDVQQVAWAPSHPGYVVLALCPPFLFTFTPAELRKLSPADLRTALSQVSPAWRQRLLSR